MLAVKRQARRQAADRVRKAGRVGRCERAADTDVDGLALFIGLVDRRRRQHGRAVANRQHEALRGLAALAVVGGDLDRVGAVVAARGRLGRQHT